MSSKISSKAKFYYISGSDTDAGKSTVCAGLLRCLSNKGFKTAGIKAVQTGCPEMGIKENSISPDADLYSAVSPSSDIKTLYKYSLAASPELAARKEGKTISIKELAKTLDHTLSLDKINLVEIAGGIYTPLNKKEFFIDLFNQLPAPMILVVPHRLGSINQCLMSYQSLIMRGLKLKAIVLVETAKFEKSLSHADEILIDNVHRLKDLCQLPVIVLRYQKNLNSRNIIKKEKAWDSIENSLKPLADILTSETHTTSLEETPEKILDFDKNHLWHPYTSALKPSKSWEAVVTDKNYIYLEDGTKLIDGMSSWWSAIHGYAHPHLKKALDEQSRKMSHVMFGGFTHKAAVQLGQKLLNICPAPLEHIFYADSGSVSVEVAMKMALQYQKAQGRDEKAYLMTFMGGYHGDTIGAMGVCDPITGMHGLFKNILPRHKFLEKPRIKFSQNWEKEETLYLEKAFAKYAPESAAFIVEPIVQGAGGMYFYHPQYLREIKRLCQKYDMLLILDEIATGFGRTGKLFACEWADISPDIMCIGKALTGGAMTLAATLSTKKVACGISSAGGVLMHGPTFMGNPLACAVAGASLELLASYDWKSKVENIEKIMKKELLKCQKLDGVKKVRVLGAIGVVEMKEKVQLEAVQEFLIKKWQVWVRPFGNLIYIMPPYLSPDEDIIKLCKALHDAILHKAWV